MKYLAVKVAYDGARFSGSQRQPDLRTVESDIMRDICLVLQVPPEDVDLRMAGRTDKGVNALGNLAVFNADYDPETLLKAMNANSYSIFYRAWAEVDEDFNPRFADRRIYEYCFPDKDMDLDLARECASMFVGEHDFKRFCRPDGKPTTAKIDSIEVIKDGGIVVLRFTA